MSEQPTTPAVIPCTAPIAVSDLKRKFTEDVVFVIDVDASKLKGRALLTYLSNLNTNIHLQFGSVEATTELLRDYMASTLLISIAELEDLAINLLLAATGRAYTLPFEPASFIEENEALIETWLKRLDSLPVFALYCHPAHKEAVEQTYPEDTDESMAGLNFVKLIEHELFPVLMAGVQESDYNWNRVLFNEYIFAGDNLFKFFASKNNPYFIALLADECPEEFGRVLPIMQTLVHKTTQCVKEIEHVSHPQ